MSYVTQDGNYLKSNQDFEAHLTLEIPIDVEELESDGVLTTGLIQEFNNQYVKVNDHYFNRETQIFVSRPFYK
ncbi:hypothetical protein [Bacillus sp. FJAT-29814]|uniref:hypothetical protein n=1 Tax=Bacillus sp. FJAT-29814 TaxID=1729688 RepID=UPI00082DB4DF|nr:hypothetical protein [Bacillus sp. FJAT-29814]